MSIVLSLALGLSAPVALPATMLAATDKTSEEAKKQKKICKRMPPPAGSRVGGKKVCATKAEWDLAKKENEEALRRAGRSSYQEGGAGAGAFNKGD